jgi:hypothetical protein
VVPAGGATIHSLAMQVDPSNPAAVERELVAQLGSTTLVPGEHVVVP